MKHKWLFIFLAAITALWSCNKDRKNPVSIWTIDGVEYSSRKTKVTIGKAISILSCNDDPSNKWDITFYEQSTMLPNFGNWPILTYKINGNDPRYAYMSFSKDNYFYAVSPNNTNQLTASGDDFKAVYTLPPTWFIKYDKKNVDSSGNLINTNDSALISGVFKQPY